MSTRRRLAALGAALLHAPLALAGALGVQLAAPSGRSRLCAEVSAQAEQALRGSLHVDRCAALGPEHVRLEGLTLEVDGAPVLRVSEVEAEVGWRGLVEGTLVVQSLDVKDATLSLRRVEGELALARALALRGTPPAAAEEGAGAPLELPAFRVDALRLRGLRIEDTAALLPGAGDVDVALAARVAGGGTRAAVDLEALVVDAPAAAFTASAEGALQLGGGDETALSLAATWRGSRGELNLTVKAGQGLVDRPERVSAELALEVAPEHSEALGLAPSPLRIAAEVEGPLASPRLRATLGPEATPDALRLEAELDLGADLLPRTATLHAALGADGVGADVRPLLPGAPAPLAGDVTLRADARDVDLAARWWDGLALTLEAHRLRAGPLRVSGLSVGVRGEGEVLRLQRLAVRDGVGGSALLLGTGQLVLDGAAAGDAELSLRVDLDRLSTAPGLGAALGPGAAAAAEGRLRGTFELRRRGGDLEARGAFEGAELAAAGVRLGSLRLRLEASGSPDRPDVDVDVHIRRLFLPGLGRSATLTLGLHGGPAGEAAARYRAELSARDERRKLTLRADASLEGRLTQPDRRGRARVTGRFEGFWPRPLVLAARGLRWRGARGSAEAISLRAERGVLGLEASGEVDLARATADVALRAEGLRLGALVESVGRVVPRVEGALLAMLGAPPSGSVSLRAEAHGSLDAPQLAFHVDGRGLRVGPLEAPRMLLEASYDSLRRGAEAAAALELVAAGTGTLSAEASLASDRRRLVDVLRDREARVSAEIVAPGVDLRELTERLNAVGAGLPAMAGVAIVDARVAGRLSGLPAGRISLRGVALRVDGGDPLDLDAVALLGAESDGPGTEPLALTAMLADGAGPLVEARAAADVEGLLRGRPFMRWLGDAPFALDARVLPRRVDAWPRPFAPSLALRAGGEAHLRADAGAAPVGHVALDADYLGALRCDDGGQPPALSLRVELRAAEARAEVAARLAGAPAFRFEATAPAPLRRWATHGMARLPRVELHGGGEGVPLAQMPVLCSQLAGTFGARVDGTGLGTNAPALDANLVAEGMRTAGTAPVRVEVEASLVREALRAGLRLDAEGAKVLGARVSAPVVVQAGLPALDEGEAWSVAFEATDAPVAPLLAAVPGVVDPSGQLTGELRLAGRGAGLAEAEGELRLSAVAFTLRDPFQRVQRLDGGVRVEAGEDGPDLLFDALTLRDRDGRARLDGRLSLGAGFTPTGAALTLATRGFPIRDEGIPIATVDADARLDARVEDDRARVSVRMRNAAVAVPPDEGRVALGLRPHPDVTFEDEPGFGAAPFAARQEPEQPRAEESQAASAALPDQLVLRFASSPFFVRRDDFAIQLEPDVTLRADEEGVTLDGPVRVRRGTLDLLGRAFDLERGEILFTGAATIDPELDLTAVHTLPGGETVGVRITGTLERPELAFTSSEEELTEQEILDRLVRGRSSGAADETANDQARSVLAGLTAGVLSSLARRRFGTYIPVLAIESDGANQAQLRAGFSLDRLIPSWLENVLQGIYVEGVFGVEGQGEESESGRASFSTSALIELLFPRRLVGTALVDQQANWSLDLTWEP